MDGFQVHSKQKTKVKPRAYIGNLRISPDLKNKLFYLFQEKGFDGIKEADITIQKQKSCFAFVSYKNVDRIVSRLNGFEFDGRKLVVQREQKKGGDKKTSFGAGGWSGPAKTTQQSKPTAAPTAANTTNDPVAVAQSEVPDMEDHQDKVTLDDFRSRCKKPLSDLMSELGEYDPDFKKVIPTAPDETEAMDGDQPTVSRDSNSRLGKHGKVPLHVEFRSFGFVFNAPTSKGWSNAQPFPPLDCRHLPAVYDYLARQDGKSSAVKRVLLTDEVKDFTRAIADRVMNALVEAISDGHGHGLPLFMTIYVGSEQGRHRSVLVAEEAGKELRRRLRHNVGDRITENVSVGTAHQDMDRRNQKP
eukprot:CAMPEP_0119025692 /NCGR_PEP_ID=MMETSP1176-20130426/34151_1 /TAXON_ID=265551 /ORGANISM="Synedropsis recta cf, Strain CCMP1620" /LENGTH=358 /DNA_ID=CAMNT_0006981269 /DNA_START=27 /DNA_END=1100 /DNA_ORIENTATION=+